MHQPLPRVAGQAQILKVQREGQEKAVVLRKKADRLFDAVIEGRIGHQSVWRDRHVRACQHSQPFRVFLQPEHIPRTASLHRKHTADRGGIGVFATAIARAYG